ncbi:MAG: hypothetical protein QXK37_04125 [Candidatus Woesearchaeota archaeon]
MCHIKIPQLIYTLEKRKRKLNDILLYEKATLPTKTKLLIEGAINEIEFLCMLLRQCCDTNNYVYPGESSIKKINVKEIDMYENN